MKKTGTRSKFKFGYLSLTRNVIFPSWGLCTRPAHFWWSFEIYRWGWLFPLFGSCWVHWHQNQSNQIISRGRASSSKFSVLRKMCQKSDKCAHWGLVTSPGEIKTPRWHRRALQLSFSVCFTCLRWMVLILGRFLCKRFRVFETRPYNANACKSIEEK